MRVPVAPNVVASSISDALRLVIPSRRIGGAHNLRRLERAGTHEARDRLMQRWSRQAIAALDVQVAIRGMHHAASDVPTLVLPLHESLVDVPLLIDRLQLPMTFVARAELDREPPMAGLLGSSRQIMINPEVPGSLRAIIRETALLKAQGRNVVVFPQGSVLGVEVAFQPGALAVAEQLAMPVLPVVIAGSHRVWERPFSPRVRRGVRVYLEVLAPRYLEGPHQYRALEQEMKTVALGNGWAAPRRFDPERDGFWDGYRFSIDTDYPELAEVFRQRDERTPRTGAAIRSS